MDKPLNDAADLSRMLVMAMDKPLNDAADLSRVLVMALAGAGGAGFSEEEENAALETLARSAQAEVQRALDLWKRLQAKLKARGHPKGRVSSLR